MARLPDNDDRLLVVGATGTGKTVGGLYFLSQANFQDQPWLVIDTKRDENLNEINYTGFVSSPDQLPDEPGLYIYHGDVDNMAEIEAMLRACFNRENIGVYIDEGNAVHMGKPYSPALRLIMTQGRSKKIPVIINCQRPVWFDKFAISEAGFYQIFRLNSEDDKKSVANFIPPEIVDVVNTKLDPFTSIYYDVKRNEAVILDPLPMAGESISLIDERLELIEELNEAAKVSIQPALSVQPKVTKV